MSFTQSLVDFRDNLTYDEKTHALAMAKGVTNFVVKGLDLTGTTLTSGIFSNGGTFGHLGKEGETHTITANYTGYIVIKTTLSGSSSTSVIELSDTRKDTDPRDGTNIKYFTIYQLNNGAIEQDFRHINYVKELKFIQGTSGVGWFQMVLNGFKSNEFNMPALVGNVLSVDGHLPDVNGNVVAKQQWSLDELGLDGTWSISDVPGNVKKAYDDIVAQIGNETTFTIHQGLFHEASADHYEFSKAIVDSINTGYGIIIDDTLEFSITFGLYNGFTNINNNTTNYITIKTRLETFTRQFDFDAWSFGLWLDREGAPHADLAVNTESYMTTTHGLSINAPLRDYISGITFWVADYDAPGSQFTTGDATIRYVPRSRPKTNPVGSPNTDADTLFAANHSILNSKLSSVTPVTTVTEIANMYLSVNYGEEGQQYPNGITLEGLLEGTDTDVILGMIIIHYGKTDWSLSKNWLAYSQAVTYTPSFLNQPITTPEVGDNMEETSILKEVLDNA